MVTMKSLVTLVLAALVLASSMAVVASDHKGGPEDDHGGPKDAGGKPDDAGPKGGPDNAGGKSDDAGSNGGPDNAGGNPDDTGSNSGAENAGGKPDDAGPKGGSENAGGKPDDAGPKGGSENAGGKTDEPGPNGGSENSGGRSDDAGSTDGSENGGQKPDGAGSNGGSGGDRSDDPDARGRPDGAGGKPDEPGADGNAGRNGDAPDGADEPDAGTTGQQKKPDRDPPGGAADDEGNTDNTDPRKGSQDTNGRSDGPGPGSRTGNRPTDLPQENGRSPDRSGRGPDDGPTVTSGPSDRTDGPDADGSDRGRNTLRTQGGEADPIPAVVEDVDNGFRTASIADSPRPRVDFDARAAELKLEADSETPGLTSRIDGLVEYLDENGNGAYDIGEPVLDRVSVRDLEPVIRHGIEGADTREVVYTLPGGGTLTLIFHLGTSGQVGAKYDILVVDRPFHDPASRLAIGASAAVDGGVRLLEIEGQPAVAGQDGADVAYLRWVTEALVDGETVPVGWSVHISHSETVESAIIYWSYPQGMRILHDPEVGITHLPPDLVGDAELFVYGLVLTGTTLLVGHDFRRRRTW